MPACTATGATEYACSLASVAQGMKSVLSGTDSLEFGFALYRELYDRAKAILYHIHPLSRALRSAGPAQYRHLLDDEKSRLIVCRFVQITERVVLYRGEETRPGNEVRYRNVEEYRRTLPEEITMDIDRTMELGLGLVM